MMNFSFTNTCMEVLLSNVTFELKQRFVGMKETSQTVTILKQQMQLCSVFCINFNDFASVKKKIHD